MEKLEFKYHPNIFDNSILIKENGICDCCGEEVDMYLDSMYCKENVECICLACVKSGAAAKKFDGKFNEEPEELVSDDARTEELLMRTPAYANWQGEKWKTCCDDYCQFIGDVDAKELDELGLFGDFVEPYADSEKEKEFIHKNLKKFNEGSMTGYLFKCSHCGKYQFETDCD